MSENKTGEIMLNELKNEFIFIDDNLEIPNFHVKGISPEQKKELSEVVKLIIPDYLTEHSLLLEPRPKSDIYFIHFLTHISGKYYNFLHFFPTFYIC